MVEDWIEQFGPLAVFFGLMLEGEMALILAGYAIHHGYLELIPTLLAGTAGGTCSDSLYYWLGRRFGARFLRARKKLRPVRARAILMLRRWGHLMAFATRFAFGLRIALPVVMGAARMRPRIFHPYNAAGSFAFSVVYVAIGYGVGTAVGEFIRDANVTETQVVVALIAIVAFILLIREWRLYHAPESDPAASKRFTRKS